MDIKHSDPKPGVKNENLKPKDKKEDEDVEGNDNAEPKDKAEIGEENQPKDKNKNDNKEDKIDPGDDKKP